MRWKSYRDLCLFLPHGNVEYHLMPAAAKAMSLFGNGYMGSPFLTEGIWVSPGEIPEGTPQPSWQHDSGLVSKCHRASYSASLRFLFLPLFCIYLWPLYLLAAAQARHGQLTKAPVLASLPLSLCYLLSPSARFTNTRDAGHWVKHLVFCTQIVST